MMDLNNIDFALLQRQRNALLDAVESNAHSKEESELIQGAALLLDSILDAGLDKGLCRLQEDGTVEDVEDWQQALMRDPAILPAFKPR